MLLGRMKKLALKISLFVLASLSIPGQLAFGSCDLTNLNQYEILDFKKSSVSKTEDSWVIKVDGVGGVYQIGATVYPARPTRLSVAKEVADQMILFPTIEGESLLEKRVGSYFARRDFFVVIPTIEELNLVFDEGTVCRMDQMALRVQQSAILIFSELERLVPGGRQVMIGASQGGIRSISASSVLPRLHAVWANVAGGDFPSIYAESTVRAITSFRTEHMAVLGLSVPSDYEAFLRSNLTLDPIQSCPERSGRLAMVIALNDGSVPTANQQLLRESCAPDYVRFLEGGHIRGAADLWLKRREVRKFLEQN